MFFMLVLKSDDWVKMKGLSTPANETLCHLFSLMWLEKKSMHFGLSVSNLTFN